MYSYSANAIFDRIIQKIMMQDYTIRHLGVEPNRVILGKRLFDILHHEYNTMLEFRLGDGNPDKGMDAYVCGLPVTVDLENKWIIEVCYGFEADGKQVAYPDKKDWWEV